MSEKQKRKFWPKFFFGAAIILGSIMLAIWMTGNTYIYKTLIYTYPGIDDINIFATRMVNDSAPQPWPLSSSYNKEKLDENTESELQKNQSVAFLVIKDDSICFEQYWDRYTDKTFSNSFSVAKSIVGVLAGIAVHDSLFSLEDPVGRYIPEFMNGDNVKLKIKHLLMMSSGLNWDESYNSLFSKTTEAYYGSNLKRLVTHLKVIEEPGKIFRYMSCNTVLLSMIISKTSGMTLSDFAAHKLWMPIGATQHAYWSLDNSGGIEKSYCCFYSNARDFAKIGKLYLDSGKWNGQTIVPIEYMTASTTATGCMDESGKAINYYGYHWWLMKYKNHSIFYARGILGQYIIIIPDEKIIIVRLGKLRGEKTADNQYTDMIAYTDAAIRLFGSDVK